MRITNKMNLPEAFVRMAQSDYQATPKRYSATTLLKPTRTILLQRRHDDEIEQDCSEMVWALWGQATHYIMEHNADGANEFAEEKLQVELDNGYTVSGVIDLYDIDKAEVVDWKTASVYKWLFKDFEDWRLQGLTYAWLLRKNGLPCNKVKFVAILKDHSKTKAEFEPDYPKLPVQTVAFDITDENIAEIEKLIADKIAEISANEGVKDDDLPLCSMEERWQPPDAYAVMKKGNKRALKVCDSRKEAEMWMAENGKGDYIVLRPSEPKRCLNYCACKDFCTFYKEYIANKEKDNAEN